MQSCDVICRTVDGEKQEFLAFMEAKDSSEGPIKVAIRKKVYKCLEVCYAIAVKLHSLKCS